jgi:hypothetical protein
VQLLGLVVVVVPVEVVVVVALGVASSLPHAVRNTGAEAAPIRRLLRKCFLSTLVRGMRIPAVISSQK